MKKITSIILLACVLISSVFTLTSCLHLCIFEEAWSHDANSHYHACSQKDCDKTRDSAVHSWDEGVITAKPTQENRGLMAFTCTECEYTRNEALEFTGLDEEDWAAALTNATFANFTYVEEAAVKNNGIEITTEAMYMFTDEKAFVALTIGGKTTSNTVKGEQANATRNDMARSIRTMLEHSEFTYDAENKVYNLTGEAYISSLTTYADNVVVTFKDGKISEIFYTCEVESSGVTMQCEATITISDYGTTVIK